MAQEKKVNISSSDTNGLQELFTTYIKQPGNEKASFDDFVQFLSIASPDRSIFFETYCIWEAIDMGVTIVIKVDPKGK